MRSSTKAHRQQGFSLVELMVAMVLSLILMGGVISIFVSSKRSYGTNTAIAQLQENARFAFSFLAPVVREAGYMGCTKSVHVNSILNPGFVFNFQQGIAGFEYTGTNPGNTTTYALGSGAVTGASWSPTLDPSILGLTPPPVAGSDVLVIYSTNNTQIVPNQFNAQNANFAIENGTPTSYGLFVGELGIVTDCVKADIMQFTNTTGNHVEHAKNNSMSPGNFTNKLPDQFGANGHIVFPQTYMFYIAKGADGGNSLYQATINTSSAANNLQSQELVSGIDDMQILYGVDPLGTGDPTYYDTADNVATAGAWSNVLSVEISLLVRSNTNAIAAPAATSFTMLGTRVKQASADTVLRRVFTTTIGIRNSLQ